MATRIVHSLWAKPLLTNQRGLSLEDQLKLNAICFASSFAYAKSHGAEVVLFADGLGIELLKFIPYDEVHMINVPDGVPTEFWAAGKFFALQQMRLGDIHIDGDVFLQSKKVYDMICKEDYDCIVQCIEDDRNVLGRYYANCREIIKNNKIELQEGLHADYSESFNCGVVGFRNQELKDKYIAAYFDTLNKICGDKKCVDDITNNKECWMDLLLEQQFLYEIANEKYKVYNLLGGGKEVAYDKAKEIGFSHMVGAFKGKYIKEISEQLKAISPDLFTASLSHVGHLTYLLRTMMSRNVPLYIQNK